jgi:hypothetical protein
MSDRSWAHREWEAVQMTDDRTWLVYVAGTNWLVTEVTGTCHTEEHARLIAVAPGMLARLKARRANCVCDTDGSGYNLPPGRAVCDECHADAALIAKAEGK